jgi:cold shock CspA family protein
MIGYVRKVNAAKKYGFIRARGVDYFFLATDLEGIALDERLVEMRVRFEHYRVERGWQACAIRPTKD